MPVTVYTLVALLLTVEVALSEFEVFRGPCHRTGLFQASKEDRALVGYKLDTYLVQDEIECGRRCVSYEGCMSYNYEHKINRTNRRTCELNSQTKESKPQAFKEKDGFQYYGSLHERKKSVGCEKYKCYNNGRCVDRCHGDMFYCHCTELYRGKQCERFKARNCKELIDLGQTKSGGNQVAPDDKDNGFSVYCDQTNDGGGWLVFQKRTSPFTTLFSKNWKEYEEGFGHSINSFWLGNQYLSRLTKNPVQLRIELVDRDGYKGYAVYNNFSISGPEDNYRLSVGAYVEGNIGNALHGDSDKAFVEDGMQFSTVDRDNDRNNLGNCATVNGPSGWWLSNCGRANLNQALIPQWDAGWLYSASIISSEMKIR